MEISSKLIYRFYSKPMASPYTTLEMSERALNSMSDSLAMVVRKLLDNMSRELTHTVMTDILERFAEKLAVSVYSRVQAGDVVLAGMNGVENRWKRLEKERKEIHPNNT